MNPDHRLRLSLLSRVAAAALGGYALSAIAASALALLLPGPRSEGVLWMSMGSFAIFTAAVLWVFAARSAGRAWLGLLCVAAPCALVLGWRT